MTDLEAATAAWYAVKADTRNPSPTADPTPYIAAIVGAVRPALQPDDLDTLADAVAYFNGMDSAAGRHMAGAIGRAIAREAE